MAITAEQTGVILELHGKRYSERKIADQTEHSPNTIRKVTREARTKVGSLHSAGLEASQIAEQTGYPLPFVRRVLGEISKGNLEASPDNGPKEPSPRSDVRASYEDYKRKEAVEKEKQALDDRAMFVVGWLMGEEEAMQKLNIKTEQWDQRRLALTARVNEFLSPKIEEASSSEILSELSVIVDEVETEGGDLYLEAEAAIDAEEKRRKQRAGAQVEQVLDIGRFPEFINKQIREQFEIKNADQGSIVIHALKHMYSTAVLGKASVALEGTAAMTAAEEQIWKKFSEGMTKGGWEYLGQLANAYREKHLTAEQRQA